MEGTSGRQLGAWQQMANFPIYLHDQHQREAVGQVLGALDDKIELNRQMCQTLEEMARALYRSWFVDFDPVHAKAAGKTPPHMPPATAALFPDRFGEDGLPERWKFEKIGEHVTLGRGLSYKGAGLCVEGKGVPLHNLNSIVPRGGYSGDGIKYYSGEFRNRHQVLPGDLIVANTDLTMNERVIAYPALIPRRLGPTGIFSQHLFKVEPKDNSPLTREWLYFMLSMAPLGRTIRNFSNGTTVNMLPADAFEIPKVIVPISDVVRAFNRIVQPMMALQEDLRASNQTLATLRDTLLPKLMSGELRVKDTERQMEEVL
jgi:type I restriction enzyme S subunit